MLCSPMMDGGMRIGASVMLVVGIATVVLTAACSRETPPPAPKPPAATSAASLSPLAEARTRASQLEAQRTAMRAVHGRLPIEDADVQFVAFYDGTVLRHIEERIDYGEYGRGSGKYFLDTTGQLFLYLAEDERTVPDAERSGAKDDIRYALVFEPGGRMIASEKSVNDKVEPLQDVEIEGVVKHFEALRAAAQAQQVANP
jgi:hypothetical protein